MADYLENAPASYNNERRALLALMAEKGTEAEAAYRAQQARANELRKATNEKAAARGLQIHAPEAVQAALEQDRDRIVGAVQDDALRAQLNQAREMDRISAANDAYLAAVGAASRLQKDAIAQELATRRSGGGGGGSGGGGGFGGLFDGLLDATPAGEQVLPEDMDPIFNMPLQDVYEAYGPTVAQRWIDMNPRFANDPVLREAYREALDNWIAQVEARKNVTDADKSADARLAARTQPSPELPVPTDPAQFKTFQKMVAILQRPQEYTPEQIRFAREYLNTITKSNARTRNFG